MSKQLVGILGGTGPMGQGIATRLAAGGWPVRIGSRATQDGRDAAQSLASLLQRRGIVPDIEGADNAAVAAEADLVYITVPWSAHDSLLQEHKSALSGKVVVDAVVPLAKGNIAVAARPSEGSAAERAREILGPDAEVVAALQNVAAGKLRDLDADVDCDVLVCADSAAAKAIVLEMLTDMRLRGLDSGPLTNAGVVDGLTAILIGLNRRYGSRSAGVRITNLPG